MRAQRPAQQPNTSIRRARIRTLASPKFAGDFNSLDAAKQAAKEKAGTGTPIFIYNDRAELVVRYGSWH